MTEKTDLVKMIASGIAQLKRSYSSGTGRFLDEKGQWTLTNQDFIWPLAWFFACRYPDNPFYRSKEILNAVQKGGDAIASSQDKDGRTEFLKADGSAWGKIYMPWTMFHWLEAFRVCQPFLEEKRKERWKKGLLAAYSGISRELKTDPIHNISAWKAMSLYQAGKVFSHSGWKKLGGDFMRKVAGEVQPDGFWPEGSGPTVSYNTIYLHALGLYYFMSRDDSVLSALDKATEFHRRFLYPDGSLVETIDGRVKYREEVLSIGWPGLLTEGKGQGLISFLLKCLKRKPPGKIVLPYLTSALDIWPESFSLAEPVFQEEKTWREVYRGKACLRKKGDFFVCLSGYALNAQQQQTNAESRWLMDRSCFVSVWHRSCGLIISADNSKNQPDWANFSFWQGASRGFSPVKARVFSEDKKDRLILDFGGPSCQIAVAFPRPDRVELTFSVEKFSHLKQIRVAVPLRLGEREQVIIGQSRFKVSQLTEQRLNLKTGEYLKTKNWQISSQLPAWFFWPVYPFNPYALSGLALPEQVRAFLVFNLTANQPVNPITLKMHSAVQSDNQK
ncbi:MAG: hypothetical protein NC911_00250 [Candidatus Omnitrophica bacterium]|nr:hypothetical protein [Candidatus Omnitrophota bacterium]MCM8768108.1 hypothetical protein [Candidatus Omnitrophota bacterium]